MSRTEAADARARILAAASRLFYERGVRAVGMQRIIAEAGTGKSLLYGHFATKDDLVEAYLERWAARLERSAAQAQQMVGDDPGERIVATVTHVGHRVLQPGGRGCPFRNYLVEFPDLAGEPGGGARSVDLARRRIQESRRAIERPAKELAGPDVGAVLSEQVNLIIDGLFLRASHRPSGDDEPPVGAVLAAVDLTRSLVAKGGR